MDPNLFHIDYERLVEVLITLVVFSFFVERALAVIFESRPFINRLARPGTGSVPSSMNGIKELIAIVVSIAVCAYWKFDALTILLVSDNALTFPGSLPGYVVTGAIVAGGSKASVAFFHDVLGFMSTAERERAAAKKLGTSK